MPLHVTIRPERRADIAAIASVTQDAFRNHPHSSHTAHFIIGSLRRSKVLALSLVAEIKVQVVGHIAFSPVMISDGLFEQFIADGAAYLVDFHGLSFVNTASGKCSEL